MTWASRAVLPICGQTYTRKLDYYFLSVLSGIAQSAGKMATDLRLMAHEKEFDEPFTSSQVGSCAMAYKRNPMRSERICSLARYVLADAMNPAITASTQWLERTLDDSANRRISIPEAFLAVDAILNLVINIISGCTVYPAIMERHLREELPFLATENILMRAVELGGDRQELHEVIREYSVETARRMKETGCANDLEDKLLVGRALQARPGGARGDTGHTQVRGHGPGAGAGPYAAVAARGCSRRTRRSCPPKGRVR